MQTKEILMFATVAILVGTIVSMTTAGVVAAQTINSNNNGNINTNNCQGIDPASSNAFNSAAPTTDSETGGTDDADEPGDVDVNDAEDTDIGTEGAGEADDEEETGGTVSTPANGNVAGTNDQVAFDPCNFGNEIVNNLSQNPGTAFVAFRQAISGMYSIV
jgi:long-subunit fatty acid transport protein